MFCSTVWFNRLVVLIQVVTMAGPPSLAHCLVLSKYHVHSSRVNLHKCLSYDIGDEEKQISESGVRLELVLMETIVPWA